MITYMTGTSRPDTRHGEMYARLARYIAGENEEGVRMEMTVPVTTRMEQRPEPGTYNKKMCFLLPQEWQQSPLQPTSKDVSIERMELDVLVKRFSGYLPGAFEDAKWINHARQFRLAPLFFICVFN